MACSLLQEPWRPGILMWTPSCWETGEPDGVRAVGEAWGRGWGASLGGPQRHLGGGADDWQYVEIGTGKGAGHWSEEEDTAGQ